MDSKPGNWDKIKSTLLRLKDIDELKKEVAYLAREIQKFDLESQLSPGTKRHLKDVEAKCQQLSKIIAKTQKQFDREFNKSLRKIRRARDEAGKTIKKLKQKAERQKDELKKASAQLQKKLNQRKRKKTKTTGKKAKTVKKKKTQTVTTKKTNAKKSTVSKPTKKKKKRTTGTSR